MSWADRQLPGVSSACKLSVRLSPVETSAVDVADSLPNPFFLSDLLAP